MRFLFLVGALILSTPFPAFSYIPSSDYLVEKVVKTHGKGLFSLEQEVVFRSDAETLAVKESWIVQDGETMKMTASGGALHITLFFNNGKVYFTENGTTYLTKKMSPESLEPFFHSRTDKGLVDMLMSAKILSANPLRPRQHPRNIQQIKYESDPYIRLVRIGDDPTLLISSTTNAENVSTAPGIWIDQDSYSIKKIRFPSQAEVQAQLYQSLSQNLSFPRSRTVTWDNQTVEIRLIKCSSIAKTKSVEQALSISNLNNQSLQWGNSSLTPMIKDFYKRFR